jgi:hypothetical protein
VGVVVDMETLSARFRETYVDVLGEQVVGSLVLLDQVAVDGAAGKSGSQKEAEQAN